MSFAVGQDECRLCTAAFVYSEEPENIQPGDFLNLVILAAGYPVGW